MKKKVNLLFLSQVILLFSTSIITLCASHSCNHDTDKDIQDFYKKFAEQFNQDSHLNKRRLLSNEEQRILSGSAVSPIRVTTDLTGLNSGVITQTQKAYLTSIMQGIVTFMSNFIKVVPIPGNNIFESGNLTTCYNVNLTKNELITGIPNSDLHIYVIYKNDSTSDTYASAGWCAFYQNYDLFRPNFGIMLFNLGKMTANGTSLIQYQNDLSIILHEMIHVLGFTDQTMQYWINSATNQIYGTENLHLIRSNQNINGSDMPILKSTNVLNTARKYYSCPTLSGMQLENEGGPGSVGSHWEQTMIGNEILTAAVKDKRQGLSIFTVALLKDTGFWADVNENLAQQIYWGKGKGCDFPIKKCSTPGRFEEFSNVGEYGCTFEGGGRGYSQSPPNNDNCYYFYTLKDGDCENPDSINHPYNIYHHFLLEEYSENSKCFNSNIQHPKQRLSGGQNLRCHHYQCSKDSTEITITSSDLLDFSLICNIKDAGQIKTAVYKSQDIGQITCPSNFQRFCDNQNCKNFCSFNGICIGRMCMCNPGRTSDDCSMTCSVYSENGACVSACQAGKFANMDNVCRETCPKGFYPANGVCNLCDFSCSKCSGPESNQCTACQFLTFLSGNTCVPTCPTGTYADESSKSCLDCPNGCTDCTSGTVCGNCNNGFAKTNDLCVELVCSSNCATCIFTSTQCSSCQNGKYLDQAEQTCVTSCPPRHFPNSSNNTCTQCSSRCDTCSSESLCTRCKAPNVLQRNVCQLSCYSRYYADSNNVCQRCDRSCKKCTGTSATCTACNNPMKLSNNRCVKTVL